MIVESTSDSAATATAFSALGSGWQLGRMLGPSLGAAAARPSTRYWPTFLSRDHPFLLPGLIAAALPLITVLLGIYYIRETRTWPPHAKRYGRRKSASGNHDDEQALLEHGKDHRAAKQEHSSQTRHEQGSFITMWNEYAHMMTCGLPFMLFLWVSNLEPA